MYDDDSHDGGCVFQRMCFDGLHTVEDIIVGSVMSVEGLAIDWMSRNLYWVDSGRKVIEMARLSGLHRKVIIPKMDHKTNHTILDKPRAIAVDPQHG